MNKVPPLTEDQARKILEDVHSEASNPRLYSATREEGAWVFSWRDTTNPIPMGVRSEIVTDSGREGRFKIGETTEQAIRRLSGLN